MPTTTAQKLKIKEGDTIHTLHAPHTFATDVGPLPAGVRFSTTAKNVQQIHWFFTTQAQLKKEFSTILESLVPGVIVWLYFPKGSSKMQTDLTRDTTWEILQQHQALQMLTLISFNSTWSAFAVRLQNASDQKKKTASKERPIFAYIDPATKQVFPPEDFAQALVAHPKEKGFFDALSFSNKKEYVEWIVTAKKEETRANRVKEAIERLSKEWKNPANR